jgi:hypothetical protein
MADRLGSMILLGQFLALSHSFRKPSITNAYTLVPGNWTEVRARRPLVHPVIPVDPNVSTFSGSYNETDFLIVVTSNTTGNATFGNYTFDFELRYEREAIAFAEIDISDGSHVSLSVYSNQAIEFSVFPAGGGDLRSFGFVKPPNSKSSWWEVGGIVGLALFLTWLLKRFCPEMFS